MEDEQKGPLLAALRMIGDQVGHERARQASRLTFTQDSATGTVHLRGTIVAGDSVIVVAKSEGPILALEDIIR